MSIDGVSESKSTSISLDVYSIKFDGCRDVFPIKIVRPIQKGLINHQEQFACVLNDLIENSIKLSAVVADNPKRSFIRNSMQFSSTFGCEYCFSAGVPFKSTNQEEASALLVKMEQQRTYISQQIENLLETVGEDNDQVKCLKKLLESRKNCKKCT